MRKPVSKQSIQIIWSILIELTKRYFSNSVKNSFKFPPFIFVLELDKSRRQSHSWLCLNSSSDSICNLIMKKKRHFISKERNIKKHEAFSFGFGFISMKWAVAFLLKKFTHQNGWNLFKEFSQWLFWLSGMERNSLKKLVARKQHWLFV